MMRIVSILLVGSMALPSASQKFDPRLNPLQELFQRYQATRGTQFSIRKKVTLALLGKEKRQSGRLQLVAGKLRLDLTKPEPQRIIFDGEQIWLFQEKPGSKDWLVSRVRGRSDRKNPLLSFLLGDAEIWQDLQLVEVKPQKRFAVYRLQPRRGSGWDQISEVTVTIGKGRRQTLQRLSYRDELDNETLYEFTGETPLRKVNKKRFEYSPPAGTDITEY